MNQDDNDEIIPTLVDETSISSAKVPVTILTGYLGKDEFNESLIHR